MGWKSNGSAQVLRHWFLAFQPSQTGASALIISHTRWHKSWIPPPVTTQETAFRNTWVRTWKYSNYSQHGSLNVPIEHHPTIRYIVYNGYYKVMSNIPKMGHLPTPAQILIFLKRKWLGISPIFISKPRPVVSTEFIRPSERLRLISYGCVGRLINLCNAIQR